MKQLTIVILGIVGGVLGNWIANGSQLTIESLLGEHWLIGTVLGVAIVASLIVLLEIEPSLAWSWPWHRYWYLQEIRKPSSWEIQKNPALWKSKKDLGWQSRFARLQLSSRKRNVGWVQVSDGGQSQDMVELLTAHILGKKGTTKRALVLGEPGSGKTTGLTQLSLELAQSGVKRLGIGQIMPVLLPLNLFEDDDLLEFVKRELRSSTPNNSGKVLASGIDQLAQKGRVALLFDALDEALGDKRNVALAELGKFLKAREYESVPVIITARTREEPGGELAWLPSFEVQDLSDEAVDMFIHTYGERELPQSNIKTRLEQLQLLEPKGLGRNPFWLRIILENRVFETNKGRILNAAVDILINRELREKPETKRTWNRIEELTVDKQGEETKNGLAWLGYRMSLEKSLKLDEIPAAVELKTWLKQRPDIEELRHQDILGLGRDAQLLTYDPGPIEFRHRLIQEFMAAWAVAMDKKLFEQQLVRLVRDRDWWETLLMLGDICADQELAGKLVIDHTTLVRVVLNITEGQEQSLIALVLLSSATNPNADLKKDVFSALVVGLRGGISAAHGQIASELARIANTQLLELVSEMLNSSEVSEARCAASILGILKSKEAAHTLITHIGDRYLSSYVVQVLIEIGELSVEPLIAVLKDRNSRIRGEAMEALGKIGEPAVEPLIAALKDRNSTLRLGATKLLGDIGDVRAVEPLIAALKDDNPMVRLNASWALGKIGEPAVEPLIAALKDDNPLVKMWARRTLARIGEPAVEPLIAALQDDNPEVRKGVREALRLIPRDG